MNQFSLFLSVFRMSDCLAQLQSILRCCLPIFSFVFLFLPPLTVPCRTVFVSPPPITWPNHISLRRLIVERRFSQGPLAYIIRFLTSLLVMWFLCEMPSNLLKHLIFKAWTFFSNSAVRVHVSHA